MNKTSTLIAILLTVIVGCSQESTGGSAPENQAVSYDVIIQNGVIYDGSGEPGYRGDVAILDDRIAAIGDLDAASADEIIDADGMAVAPGFINMLSWAVEDLIADGRGLGDLRQGGDA